jgi:hypothetical protein
MNLLNTQFCIEIKYRMDPQGLLCVPVIKVDFLHKFSRTEKNIQDNNVLIIDIRQAIWRKIKEVSNTVPRMMLLERYGSGSVQKLTYLNP